LIESGEQTVAGRLHVRFLEHPVLDEPLPARGFVTRFQRDDLVGRKIAASERQDVDRGVDRFRIDAHFAAPAHCAGDETPGVCEAERKIRMRTGTVGQLRLAVWTRDERPVMRSAVAMGRQSTPQERMGDGEIAPVGCKQQPIVPPPFLWRQQPDRRRDRLGSQLLGPAAVDNNLVPVSSFSGLHATPRQPRGHQPHLR
jgi:hypothetical protein